MLCWIILSADEVQIFNPAWCLDLSTESGDAASAVEYHIVLLDNYLEYEIMAYFQK